jgi:hypothetical protein
VRLGALLALAGGAAASTGACTSSDGQAPKLPRQALLDPATCKQCHADHYREWSGSMHAYASEDPVFLAMNRRGQRETGGALGAFCVNCHAPMAVREGATKDGLNLDAVPASLKGVTCFFCHTADSVEGTHNAPLHLSDAPVMRGGFADPVANSAHEATYSPLHDRDKVDSAKLCGACHDIVTDHGAAIERTFAEWQASVFSQAPGGATCGQCHMDQSKTLEPVAQAPNVFSRRRHAHGFSAIDTALTPFPEADAQRAGVKALLDTTLQSALCVSAGKTQLRVFLDNVAGGHAFPSGSSQDRRVWVEVAGYAGGAQVYASGQVADGTAVTAAADPDLWLMRDCMFDGGGAEVHMFWEAAGVEGNGLPAQATFDPLDPRFYQTHLVRSYPRAGNMPSAVDRVTMRVRVRPMGLDVLDSLVGSGDLDPAIRNAMGTLDVGEPLEWKASDAASYVTYEEDRVPFSCVTKTNFDVKADKVPALERARCKP